MNVREWYGVESLSYLKKGVHLFGRKTPVHRFRESCHGRPFDFVSISSILWVEVMLILRALLMASKLGRKEKECKGYQRENIMSVLFTRVMVM